MKGIAWVLCLNLLVANMLPSQDMHELSEAFELVAHYQAHVKSDHHDVRFLDFLLMHYADEGHQREGGHEHLPFHHPHPSPISGFFLAFSSKVEWIVPLGTWFSTPHLPYHSCFLSPFVHAIWQPPKIG